MTLTVNTSASVKELTNEALVFSKYGNDAEAMVYLNSILEELKWKMRNADFCVFTERVNKLVKSSNEL